MFRVLAITGLLISSASAVSAASLSPSDRALKRLLVDAKTDCTQPIYIVGTGGTLGGEVGTCGDATIEQLKFSRSVPVYVKLVDETGLAEMGPRQCMDIFKFQPPAGSTKYNVRQTGPFTFKTSSVCVAAPSGVTKLQPRDMMARDTGSDSVRIGR